MKPLLLPNDIIEVEPGRPVPDGRVCFVKIGAKERFRLVFKIGEYYCLKPLNPDWSYKTEYIHLEKVETFVTSEVSKVWLAKRWKYRKK
jgi:hypothetical protein